MPAIAKASAVIDLRAIYSRSKSSAESLREALDPSVRDNVSLYYFEPENAETSLDVLLARSDITAVIIALPIPVQPSVIKKALEAGKHVLSEKPVAADVATAKALLAKYEMTHRPRGLVWLVAENFAFESAFLKARDLISGGQLGTIRHFDVALYAFVPPDGKYQMTAWRTKPQYQGGFLLDGGVHWASVIRTLFDGSTIASPFVNGRTEKMQAYIEPADTLRAIVELSGGPHDKLQGNLTLSFGIETASLQTRAVTVLGSKGTLAIDKVGSKYLLRLPLDKLAAEEDLHERAGVDIGVETFAKAVLAGIDSQEFALASEKGGPKRALWDLSVIEASLKSAVAGGVRTSV